MTHGVPQGLVDDFTAAVKSVVERQRKGTSKDWDRELADVIEQHMLVIAERAANDVAFGAPVATMHDYLHVWATNTAKAWNDATRAAIGTKADTPDPFDTAADVRAPVLAQTTATETNSFAKRDTADTLGMVNKTWIGGTRPEHAEVDGESVPLDQPFSNGMDGPGGPNCGCDLEIDTPTTTNVVPLTRGDLDIPADSMSRTRAVTRGEYQRLATEGKNLMNRYATKATAPSGLDGDWAGVQQRGWDSVQEEWGGATIDSHSGVAVEFGQDKYALTMKDAMQDSVSVPIGSTRETFDAAMSEARKRFDKNLRMDKAHLGVFRNEETGSYEIDPVLVVDSKAEVERIGAYTRAKGGAFSFKDGNGYWPPYVK